MGIDSEQYGKKPQSFEELAEQMENEEEKKEDENEVTTE